MANQESRSINSSSPKFLVETGNNSETYAGKCAYSCQAITDSGLRFIMAHHENGITRINPEGSLEIVAGDKNPADSEDIILIALNGHIDFKSTSGHVNTKAQQIVLQATEEIVIDAPMIRIGSSTLNATKEIRLIAQDVKVQIGENEPKNMGDVLKVSNIFKSMSGPGSVLDISKLLNIS